MKKYISKLIGNGKVKGILDYIFMFKKFSKYLGNTAFNGQELRQKIYYDILKFCDIKLIIETGSFRGATTEFFIKSSPVNIYSCEISSRYFIFTRLRFLGQKRLKLYNSNSVEFLEAVSNNPDATRHITFFYLDAHWEDNLPLFEELKMILKKWDKAVIMIDDFKVDGDSGYGFDNYGINKVLELKYIAPLLSQFNVFFPISSTKETGNKRGSVILTNDMILTSQIEKSLYLRKFT
jgi:hypothetical protein